MCHRFHIKTGSQEIADLIGAKNRSRIEFVQKDLFPLATGPIARCDDGDSLELVDCVWSLVPRNWKPSKKFPTWKAFVRKYPTFNARCESIDEKLSFRASFRDRRALIPVTAFFEHGMYFGHKELPTFFFAGLWDRCVVDGEPIDSFTIVTTAANALVGKHHPRNRMPVILPDADSQSLWMDHAASDRQIFAGLFKPLDEDQMNHWPAEPRASSNDR